jgi:cell division protein ZapA (FtsZ GTPase activity inhibitor)
MTKYEKYKISLLGLFVIGSLLCLYEYSKNGRYISNETEFTRNVIDTRSGTVYRVINETKIEIKDFESGKSNK